MNKAEYIFEKLAYAMEMEKTAGPTKVFNRFMRTGKHTPESAYAMTAQAMGHKKGDKRAIELVKEQIAASGDATQAHTKWFKMTPRDYNFKAKNLRASNQQIRQTVKHNSEVPLYYLSGKENGLENILQGVQAERNVVAAKSLREKALGLTKDNLKGV